MRPQFLSLLVFLAALPATVAAEPGVEFFEKKIRPLLAEHCYSCHSTEAKKQKGGLLLDTREGLRKGGESGPALVPGKLGDSLLIKAVRYGDPELKMPPKGKLSGGQIADLEKWVAMGAPDPRNESGKTRTGPVNLGEGPKFWAFQPPKMPDLPVVKDGEWPRKNLDRFILAGLEAKDLRPAKNADRATLIRRLYFALIGLPPTPQEIDAFVQDRSDQAVAGVVDHLLASPHFGERWGRHWLDVARFAESSGGGRSLLFRDAWRYRDYVIGAFNADTPYNQFIREQLAGDLLPAKNSEERSRHLVATAFLLLGPTNFERQDKPILEMDVIDEQIDTMGKAFLGVTLGCARCHDHKFDPIPTRDYYALAGIFKSTKFIVHGNVSRWMERPMPLAAEQELAFQNNEKAMKALKEQIKLARALAQKSGDTVPTKGTPLAVKNLPGIVIDDSQAVRVGNWKQSTFTGHYIGAGYLYDDRAMKGEKTLTFQPVFSRSGFYEVRFAYLPFANRADKVAVRIFHRDGDDTVHVNQKLTPPIDGRFISLGRYHFEKGDQWFVMVTTAGANGHVVADAVQFLSDDEVKKERAEVRKKEPEGKKGPPMNRGKTLAQMEDELKRLQALDANRPRAMAVAEGDKIDDFYVCVRGNVHNKGDRVARGFLQATMRGFPSPPKIGSAESGRRELADWIASPENPLTARVMVNRIWHHLFGAGLVRTVDNLGSTGELPSHPELLDYLALRFAAEGWSVKKLIREIVLSRTFQMSGESQIAEDAKKIDPENRLLWKRNRRRLDAESLRDAILSVSGQLERTVFGNNIKKGTVAERDYQFDDVRRSVYAPVFRNRLLELFEVFDFPDPNIVMGRRNVSTVPTQALYLMNNPFVTTQARQAARALLKAEVPDDAGRLDIAFRKSLGRLPTERERHIGLAYLAEAKTNDQRQAAWERFFQALFACVDFRYVN